MERWLPRGGVLDEAVWAARHRGICLVLWAHVLLLPLIALFLGQAYLHGLTEVAVIAWLAIAAEIRRFGPGVRSASATVGLLVSSAMVVHLYHGQIEAHFHFFVMVAVVALYQAWLPYLLALAFVVVHHSVAGAIAPEAVYNHGDAWDRPLLWGLIHGAFILAESVACLVYWRASEQAIARERQFRAEVEQSHRELVRAQQLSGVGSWEWDLESGTVVWSEQLFALTGADSATFVPSTRSFLDLVHPEEREHMRGLIRASLETGAALDYECRIRRADGTERTVHALGELVAGDDVEPRLMRGTCHDVTERRRLQDAVTQMAFQDPLTGLANRRLFVDELERALARVDGGGPSCAILFIDLDGFKQVNDRHGHAVGDALLREIGSRIRMTVREADTVARFGGDEFAVLCHGSDRKQAVETALRIEGALAAPAWVEGHRITVGVSTGVAVADADSSADALLRRADAGMYAAKAVRRPAIG